MQMKCTLIIHHKLFDFSVYKIFSTCFLRIFFKLYKWSALMFFFSFLLLLFFKKGRKYIVRMSYYYCYYKRLHSIISSGQIIIVMHYASKRQKMHIKNINKRKKNSCGSHLLRFVNFPFVVIVDDAVVHHIFQFFIIHSCFCIDMNERRCLSMSHIFDI